MLFVLKAWTVKEDGQKKLIEVLDKVGMKIMPSKSHQISVENNDVT
jgi:hypothetical protein